MEEAMEISPLMQLISKTVKKYVAFNLYLSLLIFIYFFVFTFPANILGAPISNNFSISKIPSRSGQIAEFQKMVKEQGISASTQKKLKDAGVETFDELRKLGILTTSKILNNVSDNEIKTLRNEIKTLKSG
jgi:hypothetical protein